MTARLAVALALLFVPGGIGQHARAADAPAIRCTLPPARDVLPAGRKHGLIGHLRQYPMLSLATDNETTAARALLTRVRAMTARWSDPKRARAAGYDPRLIHRTAATPFVTYTHAEQLHERTTLGPLDPRRPKAVIYANIGGTRLVPVGAMFSAKRGEPGPTPGGPITRWHSHLVCAKGEKRGLQRLGDGRCPEGARVIQGSEMLHVWFTRDLRSAFAIRAPEPELCRDGLLPRSYCATLDGRLRGM